jgi:hypothetical protein
MRARFERRSRDRGTVRVVSRELDLDGVIAGIRGEGDGDARVPFHVGPGLSGLQNVVAIDERKSTSRPGKASPFSSVRRAASSTVSPLNAPAAPAYVTAVPSSRTPKSSSSLLAASPSAPKNEARTRYSPSGRSLAIRVRATPSAPVSAVRVADVAVGPENVEVDAAVGHGRAGVAAHHACRQHHRKAAEQGLWPFIRRLRRVQARRQLRRRRARVEALVPAKTASTVYVRGSQRSVSGARATPSPSVTALV